MLALIKVLDFDKAPPRSAKLEGLFIVTTKYLKPSHNKNGEPISSNSPLSETHNDLESR